MKGCGLLEQLMLDDFSQYDNEAIQSLYIFSIHCIVSPQGDVSDEVTRK